MRAALALAILIAACSPEDEWLLEWSDCTLEHQVTQGDGQPAQAVPWHACRVYWSEDYNSVRFALITKGSGSFAWPGEQWTVFVVAADAPLNTPLAIGSTLDATHVIGDGPFVCGQGSLTVSTNDIGERSFTFGAWFSMYCAYHTGSFSIRGGFSISAAADESRGDRNTNSGPIH